MITIDIEQKQEQENFSLVIDGYLASGGSLYLITTPLNVFVSSERQNL